MPKRLKITREEIINAAFEIARKEGMEKVSNRAIAKKLNSSIRPIYYQFKNAEELHQEVYEKIDNYFYDFLLNNGSDEYSKYRQVGINYITFAKKEKKLFQAMFMSGTKFSLNDLFESGGNYNKIKDIIKTKIKIEDKKINSFHTKMWIFSHGIATLVATSAVVLSDDERRKGEINKMKNLESIVIGLILIAIGVIIGLNTLNITDINIFFDGWWTLFIIIPSIISLLKFNSVASSLTWLTIGVVLLLCCQGILSFDLALELLLPIILIAMGLSFIFKNLIGNKVSEKIKEINNRNDVSEDYCSTFSSQNINIEGKAFEGTTLNAVFGGIKLDVSNAIIEKDIVINASSIFGGIDIIVPEGINIVVKSNSIFGGVDDKRRKAKTEKENKDGVTIYVNATCLFGGVDIK